MTGTLLDLYTSPQAEDFVAGLREECERVYEAHDRKWTKAAVNDLHRIDSTIKESMRFTGLGLIALNRKVVDKNGVDFGGKHIPANVTVSVASGAIHRDPEFVWTTHLAARTMLTCSSSPGIIARQIRSMRSASRVLERR